MPDLLQDLHNGPATKSDARHEYLPQLADQLAGLSRTGHNAAALLAEAATAGPLPDDHAAAALWWRIQRTTPTTDTPTPVDWTQQLPALVGETIARQLTESPLWPTLERNIAEAIERGWQPDQLLADPTSPSPHADPCLTLLARISTLTQEPAGDEPDPNQPPEDLHDGWEPPEPASQQAPAIAGAEAYDRLAPEQPDDIEAELAMDALLRGAMGSPEITDTDIARQMDRADVWRTSPVTRDRLVQINQLTHDYYASHLPDTWGQQYLIERFGTDLTGHPIVQPGQAPAGWTHLVQHLRGLGVTDTEMLTAGVARTASTGRLIDQFRDRIVFPITNPDGEILGFVGRRHPTAPDHGSAGPKYLNTSETPLFHKSDQFYGTLRPGTIPVIVEGPMDAIAITLGSNGHHTGLAPLGTALTDQQAALLQGQPDVIIATDADLAGHVAAERDYWQLTPHGIDPRRAQFPAGNDPADLLTNHGPHPLAAMLQAATHMADIMVTERIANLPTAQALEKATQIIAARPPQHWDTATQQIARSLNLPEQLVRESLARHTRTWNQDPRQAANRNLSNTTDVRRRLEAATRNEQWAPIVNQIDPRLTRQPDWPALARTIQQAHEAGHDIPQAIRDLASPDQASPYPAAELRARLTANLRLAEDQNLHHKTAHANKRRQQPTARTRIPAPEPAPRR